MCPMTLYRVGKTEHEEKTQTRRRTTQTLARSTTQIPSQEASREETKMTGKDKWNRIAVNIWTKEPLTDKQLHELKEVIHNSFFAKLKQTCCINVKRYKQAQRLLRRKRREPQ